MKIDDTSTTDGDKSMTAAEAEQHQRPKDAPPSGPVDKAADVTENVTVTDVPPKTDTKKPTTTAKKKASKAARQAKDALPVDAAPKTEFDGAKTVDDLVQKYNEMVLTCVDFGLAARTVKSFADVKTGVLACERLHAQIEKARSGNSAHTTKETKVSKKAKKTAAKKAPKKTAAKKGVKKTSAKKDGGAKRSRVELPKDGKFTWTKGAKNPFREKSAVHGRVQKLMDNSGLTVAELKKKGCKTGTMAYCVREKLATVVGGGKAA